MCRLLVIFLLAISCIESFGQRKYDLIGRVELKQALDKNIQIVTNFQVTRRFYYLATEDWITNQFIPRWKEKKKTENLLYKYDTVNCETFSFYARHVATQMEDIIITVGVVFYKRDIHKGKTDDGHAINVILVESSDGSIKPVFFEPQSDDIVKLSKDELKSCYFLYF
jgi:hypothetical protein